MASSGSKEPKKSILKTPRSSYERANAEKKDMKWDEGNILETYHPPNKDYGFQKIDEPKTPFERSKGCDSDDEYQIQSHSPAIDPDKLTEALDSNKDAPLKSARENPFETPEEKQKRMDFEQKRKMHYNEAQSIALAKKLMEEEDDEEDDEIDQTC